MTSQLAHLFDSKDIALVCLQGEVPSNFSLLPAEAACLSDSASYKRRHEFTLGRAAAALALEKLSIARTAIVRDNTRAPVWPEAVTGSISHKSGIAIAVVASTKEFLGLGVDVEHICHGKNPDIFQRILTKTEKELLKLTETDPELLALKIFSAKEAVYKACNGLSPISPRFADLSFRLDNQGSSMLGSWETTAPKELKIILPRPVSQNIVCAGHVFSSVAIPTPNH